MITIPAGNWMIALADAIASAPQGETIHVRTRSQAELGKSAAVRMCPNKGLIFEFEHDDLQDITWDIISRDDDL